MIDKQHGRYVIICDICCNEADERFDTFTEAVDGKKKLRFRSKMEGGGWIDVCPECQV